MITSAYEKAKVSGLFETHLQVPSVSIECLIEELEYLRDSHEPETNGDLHATVSKVYNHLANMNTTAEQRQTIRLVDFAARKMLMLTIAVLVSRKRN